jgi:peptide/nickel transport system permease protein
MLTYVFSRLLIAIPILIGISLVVFLMLDNASGDQAVLKLGARAHAQSIARLWHELGLDRPLAVQYLDYQVPTVTDLAGPIVRTRS